MTKYKLAKKREKKVAEDKKVETTTPKKVEKKEEKPKTDLPQVSTKDWNLVLVNRDN